MVRTAAGRCSFGTQADEFMRDKFLFGLNESFSRFREDIFYRDGQRKPDDPPFTLSFVVSQALSYEAVQNTNKILQNSTTEEQIYYNSATSPNMPKPPTGFSKYNVSSFQKSCRYCGNKQSHPRESCPASGQICSCCRKTGHFAKVCMQRLQTTKGKGAPRSQFPKSPPQKQEQVRLVHDEQQPEFSHEGTVQYEQCFTISSIEKQNEQTACTNPPQSKGYFVMLSLSSPQPDKSQGSIQLPFQIDSAASCNTLPAKYLPSMPWAQMTPTNTLLQPYAGPPIYPVGQVTLEARRGNNVGILTFQVIDTTQPALLSVSASKNLGVLSLDADFAYKYSSSTTGVPASTQTEATTIESAVGPPPPPPDTSKRSWPPHGTLTMEFITQQCPTLFNGTVYLGPPVDFDLDPNVKPTHAPVHRQPVSKLNKVKAALDTYEATGHLVRVSQPTEWISNMVVRERAATPTKPGKMRVCLDPSQTLNKAIRRPKYIIPNLEENLHKLHNVKYMTIIDVKEAFLNIPLTLRSSLMTTMSTPWGRYRWTRLPFGISSASEEWQRRIHIGSRRAHGHKHC